MRWVTRDHYRKENSFNFNIEADLEKKGGVGTWQLFGPIGCVFLIPRSRTTLFTIGDAGCEERATLPDLNGFQDVDTRQQHQSSCRYRDFSNTFLHYWNPSGCGLQFALTFAITIVFS